jgi:hypothetical protein
MGKPSGNQPSGGDQQIIPRTPATPHKPGGK